MPPPSLTLRSVKGAPLTSTEEENNHVRHEERIDEVIANPPAPDEIASITAVGGTVTVAMESGALHTYSQPRAAPAAPVRDAVTGATFTPALADGGHFIRCTNAGGCVVTIPANSDVAFQVREEIIFLADTSGTISFVPASGVSFVSIPGIEYAIAQQGGWVMAKKIGTDLWTFAGWLAEEEATA